MSAISAYLENELLDQIFLNAAAPAVTGVYLQLHTADPTETGLTALLNAANITHASYATRPAVAFATPAAGGSVANTGAVTITDDTKGPFVITHISLWNTAAHAGGQCLFFGALNGSRTIALGGSIVFAIGDIIATLD